MRVGMARRTPVAGLPAWLVLLALATTACSAATTAGAPAEPSPHAAADVATESSSRPQSPPDRGAVRGALPAGAHGGRDRPEDTRAAEPDPATPSFAAPASITIPAIDVDSPLIRLGLDGERRLEVPADDEFDLAGWYRHGPRPGNPGPAVIAGHVDSVDGPSVFYRLATLQEGDEIAVTDERAEVAVFVVDEVEQVGKDAFPTEAVYGDTPGAELRLITCGGAFDEEQRSYDENVIVYASLTD